MKKCDRCGKPIVYKGLISKIEARKSRLKPMLSIISIWNGGVDPYAYTSETLSYVMSVLKSSRNLWKLLNKDVVSYSR